MKIIKYGLVLTLCFFSVNPGCEEQPLYFISLDQNESFVVQNENILCGADFIDTVHSRVYANQTDLGVWCKIKDRSVLDELDFKPIQKPKNNWMDSTIANIRGNLFEVKSSSFYRDNVWTDAARVLGFNGRILWYQEISNDYFVVILDKCGNSIRSKNGYFGSVSGEYSAFYFLKNRLIANVDHALYDIKYTRQETQECFELPKTKISDTEAWVYSMMPFAGGIIIGGTALHGINSVIHYYNGRNLINIPVNSNELTVTEYYSYLKKNKDLIIGLYPSGHLVRLTPELDLSIIKIPYLFKHEPPLRLINKIPYPQREAQSSTILKGSLLIGMYPWGLIYSHENEKWSAKPIMPEILNSGTAVPYETENIENTFTRANGLSWRSWALRVTSLAVFNGRFCLGTGNMDNNAIYNPKVHTHVPAVAGNKYGQIYCADIPDYLLIDRPHAPKISFFKDRIVVDNDGELLTKRLSFSISSPLSTK